MLPDRSCRRHLPPSLGTPRTGATPAVLAPASSHALPPPQPILNRSAGPAVIVRGARAPWIRAVRPTTDHGGVGSAPLKIGCGAQRRGTGRAGPTADLHRPPGPSTAWREEIAGAARQVHRRGMPVPRRLPPASLTAVPAPDEGLAAAVGVLSPSRAAALPETRRRLRSGAWTRHGQVVVTHNGPLTPEQSAWVAVLRAGPGAVLAGVWAMREHGVRVDPPARPQVVVPAHRTWPRIEAVDVRRSRVMGAAHVHPARQPPAFRLARATLDATSLCRTPDDVRALLCAPVQQRRLRVGELRVTLAQLGPLTGRGLVLRTLDDLELGAQSIHELRFVRALRRAGLPAADLQQLRRRPDGKAYLDAWWSAYHLHVEIDGLAHLWVGSWLADLERANELEIAAPACRLRFAGFQLLEREKLVMDQVTRALTSGGWTR